MKISQVTAANIAAFAGIDTAEAADMTLLSDVIMPAAKQHIAAMIGLSVAELDRYEDATMQFYVLCSFLYDNRSMSIDNPNMNRVIESFTEKYSKNLVG